MQKSLLFAFASVPAKGSLINLPELDERIQNRAQEKDIEIKFDLKEKLLIGRFRDVDYYASYIESNKELLDWFTMAKDFELKVERKPVAKDQLLKRYDVVKKSNGNRYHDAHFMLGEIIIEEMEKCPFTSIYAFQ